MKHYGSGLNGEVGLTMCTVGNLEISARSLGMLENFQHRSDLPNIKYNYAVLFLRQIYSLFFMLQNIVLIDHLCKTSIRNF